VQDENYIQLHDGPVNSVMIRLEASISGGFGGCRGRDDLIFGHSIEAATSGFQSLMTPSMLRNHGVSLQFIAYLPQWQFDTIVERH
jgi:hypothetical protein